MNSKTLEIISFVVNIISAYLLASIIILITFLIFIIRMWIKYLAIKRSLEMVFLRILIPRMDTQQGREVERSVQ